MLARAAIFSGVAARAIVPFAGADTVLDFVSGYYRDAGINYATAADAGFAGAGTFDANGYTPTGSQVLSKAMALTGEFIVFVEFDQPTTAQFRTAWSYNSAASFEAYRHTAGDYRVVPFQAPHGSGTNTTRIATGRVGTVSKCSFNNAASTTSANTVAAQAAATFRIGNNPAGSQAFGAAIKRLAIYRSALSDAQIQALGT